MKKISFLFMLLFAAFAVNAQSVMKRDFEGDGENADFYAWDTDVLGIVDNPAKGGLNTTNKVFKWTRSGGNVGAGCGTWTLGGSAAYNEMRFLVYQNVADDLTIHLLHGADVNLGTYDMPKGVWSEVVVPIPAGGLVMNVVFKPADGRGTDAAGDFYIDEIGFYTTGGGDEPPPPSTDVMKRDFEGDTIGEEGNFFGWGGSHSVAANPAKGGLNTTDKAMKWARNGGEDQWTGFGTWTLDGSAGYTNMKFLVYQNIADDLRVLVIHDTSGGDKELGWYDMPKGVWSEVVVPIPEGGLIMNVVFKAAGGTPAAGDFYIDEIGFYGYVGGGDDDDDESVTLFYESFDSSGDFQAVLNPTTNGNLKADAAYSSYIPDGQTSFFFAEDKFALFPYYWGKPSLKTAASDVTAMNVNIDGMVDDLNDYTHTGTRIQVNTSDFKYAYLTCTVLSYWGATYTISSSTDGGNVWTQLSTANATVLKREDGTDGTVHFIYKFSENLGEQGRVILKFEGDGKASLLFDDITITGTNSDGGEPEPVEPFVLFMDFETKGTASDCWNWSGTDISVVDNPAKDDVNDTDKVLRWARPASAWPAMGIQEALFPGGSEKYEFMSFLIYQNAADGLNIQVNGSDVPMPKGVWTEIVVPIPAGGVKQLELKPGGGVDFAFDFYLDQITFFNKEPEPLTSIMRRDFETAEDVANPNFFSWGDCDWSVIANPVKGGLNTTNQVLKWSRSGAAAVGLGTWEMTGSAGYKELRFLAYQDIADGLNVRCVHDADPEVELCVIPMPAKGHWGIVTVPIPEGGLKMNFMFQPGIGLPDGAAIGDFYFDEFSFHSDILPDRVKPATPANFASTASTATSVSFSWDAVTGSDLARYIVYRSEAGATEANIVAGEATGTSVEVTGLASNSAYKFAVCAVAKHGLISDHSAAIEASTQAAPIVVPDTPTGFAASDVTETSAALSWNAVTNVTVAKYEVYCSLPGATELNIPAGEVTSGTTLNVTGLVKNSAYKFGVRAISANNEASEFATVDVLTLGIGVDGATIGITIANGIIALSEAADVTITSISGAVLNYGIVSEVNISDLPAGIYILKAGSEVVKFIK